MLISLRRFFFSSWNAHAHSHTDILYCKTSWVECIFISFATACMPTIDVQMCTFSIWKWESARMEGRKRCRNPVRSLNEIDGDETISTKTEADTEMCKKKNWNEITDEETEGMTPIWTRERKWANEMKNDIKTQMKWNEGKKHRNHRRTHNANGAAVFNNGTEREGVRRGKKST